MITFTIDPASSGFLYLLFTQLGFVVSLLLLLYLGWRRRYPMAAWIALVLLGRVCFLVGSRLGGFSLAQWQSWGETGVMPLEGSQSLWGGFLLGLIGLGLAARLLQFRLPIFRLYALALPVSLAVQRVGCLVAGCCFGSPTALPFGLRYGPHADAFVHHHQQGWIGHDALESLVVHPVPLYFMLGYLLIGGLLWRAEKQGRGEGAMLGLSLGLLALSRAIIEFFRDPVTNAGLQGEPLAGLKGIQWVCLALAAVAFLLAWRYRHRQAAPARVQPVSSLRWLAYLALLGLVFGAFHRQFTFFDVLALYPLGLLLLGLRLQQWSRQQPPQVSWGMASLLLLGLAGMGQTVPLDSLRQLELQYKSRLPSNWSEFSVGGGFGQETYRSYDCNDQLYRTSEHAYEGGYMAYAHHFNLEGHQKAQVEVSAGFGTNVQEVWNRNQGRTMTTTTSLQMLGVYGQYDSHWVGLGVGYARGNFFLYDRQSPYMVPFYFRAGPYDSFFFDVSNYRQYPYNRQLQMGIGVGFKELGRNQIRAGLSTSGPYFALRLTTRNRALTFNPYASFPVEEIASEGAEVGLRLSYQFGNGLQGYRFGR